MQRLTWGKSQVFLGKLNSVGPREIATEVAAEVEQAEGP